MGFIFDFELPILDVFVPGICTSLPEINCDWILIASPLKFAINLLGVDMDIFWNHTFLCQTAVPPLFSDLTYMPVTKFLQTFAMKRGGGVGGGGVGFNQTQYFSV